MRGQLSGNMLGMFIPPPVIHTPGNFVRWKGTDVCIDLRCMCGAMPHFDGLFLYAWRCTACGAVWVMATEVPMTLDDGTFEESGGVIVDITDEH